jgi:hypothetical protein
MRLNNFFKSLFGKKETSPEVKPEIKKVVKEVVKEVEAVTPVPTQTPSSTPKKTVKKETVIPKNLQTKKVKNKKKALVIKQLKK